MLQKKPGYFFLPLCLTCVNPVHVYASVRTGKFVGDEFELENLLVNDGVWFAHVHVHLWVPVLRHHSVLHHLRLVPVRSSVKSQVIKHARTSCTSCSGPKKNNFNPRHHLCRAENNTRPVVNDD